MLNLLFAFLVFSILLILLWVGVLAGRQFGQKQLKQAEGQKLETVSVAEGAVFALLGLLVAFTFSGAYDRFEWRKTHIIDEANAFKTAYQRLDLLLPSKQALLREELRHYLDLHLETYHQVPYIHKVMATYKETQELEANIWKEVVAASDKTANQSLAQLVIPAIQTFFEVANSGTCMMLIHAPLAIFALLIALALLGAFLAGYSTAESKMRQSIHILCYVALTALTIYVVIDLEFPRIGLIRIDTFDRILAQVRNDL
jgi:hypothetical protein